MCHFPNCHTDGLCSSHLSTGQRMLEKPVFNWSTQPQRLHIPFSWCSHSLQMASRSDLTSVGAGVGSCKKRAAESKRDEPKLLRQHSSSDISKREKVGWKGRASVILQQVSKLYSIDNTCTLRSGCLHTLSDSSLEVPDRPQRLWNYLEAEIAIELRFSHFPKRPVISLQSVGF